MQGVLFCGRYSAVFHDPFIGCSASCLALLRVIWGRLRVHVEAACNHGSGSRRQVPTGRRPALRGGAAAGQPTGMQEVGRYLGHSTGRINETRYRKFIKLDMNGRASEMDSLVAKTKKRSNGA